MKQALKSGAIIFGKRIELNIKLTLLFKVNGLFYSHLINVSHNFYKVNDYQLDKFNNEACNN